MRTLAVFIVVALSTVAQAQSYTEALQVRPSGPPEEEAARQIRERLQSEWQAVVDAEKSLGWQITAKGRRYEGDWVVRLGGWTYLFADGAVRCRISADDLSCNNEDFVKVGDARIVIRSNAPREMRFANIRMLQRGIFGKALGVGADAKAEIETIISTPDAEQRTSRRYRAYVTFTTRGFAMDPPRLVETYREQCYPNHGCHSVHWHCSRMR